VGESGAVDEAVFTFVGMPVHKEKDDLTTGWCRWPDRRSGSLENEGGLVVVSILSGVKSLGLIVTYLTGDFPGVVAASAGRPGSSAAPLICEIFHKLG
jgi:phage baseplate assembly protein gpV